jgi:hypothetical protein
VDKSHLAGYKVITDGSDSCRVCFATREYAVGAHCENLDGAVVFIKEVVLPDDVNSSKCALFHRNHGYVITEVSNVRQDEVISLDDSDSD